MERTQIQFQECFFRISGRCLSLLLIISCSISCVGSQNISDREWRVRQTHTNGVDFLNCQKKGSGGLRYQYVFKASDTSSINSIVALNTYIRDGFLFHWRGVIDTVNITLPKVIRPLRVKSYDQNEKRSMNGILRQTKLSNLHNRLGFFDSLQYFVLVDSSQLHHPRVTAE